MAAHILQIPRHLFRAMVTHCQAEWPREACGVMTGRGGVARRVFAMRNIHSHPTNRYQIDPLDQQVAMADVLAGREELVAIYHSHPTTAAYPSQTDVNMAYYPQAFYVIVSLAEDQPDIQAFRIQDGRVQRSTCRQVDLVGDWIDLR